MAAVLVLLSCQRKSEGVFRVADLQVEYMETPLGIDVEAPRFSWKMVSAKYDQRQEAYRITVKETGKGTLVYDSDRCVSDVSVGVVYRGEALKPCTRYEWTVEVWNQNGRVGRASSWFETGLMGSGWSGARWISSGQPHFSRYRSRYQIDFDLQCNGKNPEPVFIFGRKDERNFVQLNLTPRSAVLSHTTEGVAKKDWEAPLKQLPSHVGIRVVAHDYAKGYKIWLIADGTPVNKEPVEIRPYPESVWKPDCRFHGVGFAQRNPDPSGDEAVFSHFTVTEDVWNTTLYKSDRVVKVVSDTEEYFNPADESGAPMLRKSFEVRKNLVSARLYTTARGIYEYEINGERMGGDWFNPGSTDYRYRILYNTYDITPLLRKGGNGIGVMLGAGWYSDFTGYATAWQDQFGTELSLLAKIVLTYGDGSRDVIVSDDSWLCWNEGPITSDSFQNGEDYDANRELAGWSEYGYNDEHWKPATIEPAPADSVKIQHYIGSPVRHHLTLTAVSVSEPQPGVFVYDMGQNMVGVPRIRLKGEKGQEITLHFGEMIYPTEVPEDPLPPLTAEVYAERKGLAYRENYRGALSTDHYICKGKGMEVIQPHFTFHGFRYIEIHGLAKALPLDHVQGIVLESVGAQTSSFETSDADVNRLYQNIVWGQRGNFLSIPTDCPQRDERMGWCGDAQVFVRTATYNMNVDPFFSRWFHSVRDIQGDDGSYCDFVPKVGQPPYGSNTGGGAMGWMEVGIIVPWQLYLQYGDTRFISEHYASMVRYMDYLQQRAVGDIQPGSGYGDWVAIEHTNSPLTNTAYYGYDALLMSKMAAALGKYADEKKYRELHERIKEAFNREFVQTDGITKESKNVPPYHEWIAGGSGDSGKFRANTQTSYVVPLQAELFNEQNQPLAVLHLVENVNRHHFTLTTGFIGTPYLNLVLSKNGYDDVAYHLFEQRSYPSWLYPVLQGATTMWERWNSFTIKQGFGPVDMNSFNHYSFGAIQEWMFSYMLGIQPVEADPGYHRIVLAPRPGGSFQYVKGHYDSVYGRIESGWQRTEEGTVFDFTVPANTEASLQLPVKEGNTVSITMGDDYAVAKNTPGAYQLPSGQYRFVVK